MDSLLANRIIPRSDSVVTAISVDFRDYFTGKKPPRHIYDIWARHIYDRGDTGDAAMIQVDRIREYLTVTQNHPSASRFERY